MNRIPNETNLDAARKIDSFFYETPSSVAATFKEQPLALRARLAGMFGEMITAALGDCGFIKDFEVEIEMVDDIEKRIFDLMVPELASAPDDLREMLASEGGDIIRGFKWEMPTNLEVKEVA